MEANLLVGWPLFVNMMASPYPGIFHRLFQCNAKNKIGTAEGWGVIPNIAIAFKEVEMISSVLPWPNAYTSCIQR